MTCESVKMPGGGRAIICGSRRPVKRCRCGRVATLLCDAPRPKTRYHGRLVGNGTCDAQLCDRCATQVGEDRHLCREHARQGELALR